MHPEILERLRCPVCHDRLSPTAGAVTCQAAHAFDLAKEGYLNMVVGRARGTGDSAEMVTARAQFLAMGHYLPLSSRIAELAASELGARQPGAHAGEHGLVVELGAGTAHHLRAVLDRLPGRLGLAVDLSKFAARIAAKAHPRLASVVADVHRPPLPLADACAALLLNIFAPRNGPELRRVSRRDGVLLVVTPSPAHLTELRVALGLLEVDPHKAERVIETLGPHFRADAALPIEWTLHLGHTDVARLVTMGPSARHIDAATLAAGIATLPDPVQTTAAVVLQIWRPR